MLRARLGVDALTVAARLALLAARASSVRGGIRFDALIGGLVADVAGGTLPGGRTLSAREVIGEIVGRTTRGRNQRHDRREHDQGRDPDRVPTHRQNRPRTAAPHPPGAQATPT